MVEVTKSYILISNQAKKGPDTAGIRTMDLRITGKWLITKWAKSSHT